MESKSPKVVIDDLINTIEREIQNSTSTRYRTAEGDYIDTDVDYVYDWFKEYKDVLRLRYEYGLTLVSELAPITTSIKSKAIHIKH